MIEVISQLQILDAAQKELGISGVLMSKMQDTTYTIVFNKYNTDIAQFDSSLREYARHPQMLENIMDKVAQNLNKSK